MKCNKLYLLVVLIPALGMQAQTSYEATALLDTDLSGTARYVGMGGAMSALGADMSIMSTNPAGTALYRSWDAAFSFGGNGVTQRTQSNLGRGRAFDLYGSMDNVGVVIANRHSDDNTLRFVNFGFNYRNVKRFDGKMGMGVNLDGLSQTWQMAWQAVENAANVNHSYFDPTSENNFFANNYYGNPNYGWLTLLGADADLMGIDENEEYWFRKADYGRYTECLSGGIDAYDFNLSFNLLDAVYLGLTFTAYDVDRTLESTYTETFIDGDYTLQNFYRTVGSGYDLKLGVILRPFEESSFRFGVAATTPTVYTLRDYNSAIVNSNFSYYDAEAGMDKIASWEMDTYSPDAYDGDCYTDYTMISPVKVNVSVGGTVGSSLALGAEYEYSDYSSIMLYEISGSENGVMNEHTADNFTGKHTLRLGAEKTFGTFYTRAGYNYQTGGYKSDAWKMIPVNSVQTNTAYANIKSTHNFTCGIGFRGAAFYADAALLYSRQSSDFYPFDDPELQAISLSRNLVKGMMTVGLRF